MYLRPELGGLHEINLKNIQTEYPNRIYFFCDKVVCSFFCIFLFKQNFVFFYKMLNILSKKILFENHITLNKIPNFGFSYI